MHGLGASPESFYDNWVWKKGGGEKQRKKGKRFFTFLISGEGC